MKKILLPSIILVLIILTISTVTFFPEYNPFTSKQADTTWDQSSATWSQDNLNSSEVQENKTPTKEDKQALVREKIETIKKRLALKGLIIQWDSYYREDKLLLALRTYLEFYKQNPDDGLIHKKIWDTYFSLHKYASALNYYNKIPDDSEKDVTKIAKALFYSHDLSSLESIQALNQELEKLDFSQEQRFYYTNSISCVQDFHACKVKFQDHFWPENPEEENEGSLISTPENEEIPESFHELTNIKTSIENYRNFQVDEVYLKNAYLIWAWYADEMYPVAIELWKQLLEEKTDYKPILKIIAQSYFELWDYEESRKYLSAYYEIDDNDPAVAYLLGIVNERLREYVLANIYFNKALDLEYTPSIDVRRRLIQNFHILWNQENILQSFVFLIEKEENFTNEDLQQAIYYHIIYDEYKKALLWTKKWQKLFPENTNFYAYEWWIFREQWDNDRALEILKNGENINDTNLFILINIAYTHLALEQPQEAYDYFSKILEITTAENEFYKQAQDALWSPRFLDFEKTPEEIVE